MVQVLILAYGLPQLLKSNFGIQFNWTHFIIVGFIACGINSSAYMAEIIRSGLQAVDIGQTEAARSLGMSSRMTMRYVIVPQAFKIIVPAMGNEFIALIKETSILSVVGIVEVTRQGTLWASSSFLSFQAYFGVAVIYLIMTLTLARLVSVVERRLRILKNPSEKTTCCEGLTKQSMRVKWFASLDLPVPVKVRFSAV